jgi:hypothetical protein
LFHHHLFAVKASAQASRVSEPTAPLRALMVSGPMASGETETAWETLEAVASALVDLSEPELERLPAAKRSVAPARLWRPAWPRGDGSDKLQATS